MRKGFTLVEILIYIAVLAIIISAVSSFILWQIASGAKSRAIRETQYNAERALSIITQEIREAKGVYGPTSLFNVNPGQLSLENAKYLPVGETASYIDFFLCETRLCLKKESQSPVALTSDRVQVSNLVFSQIATTSTAPSIQINLKIDYKTASARPEYQSSFSATTTASLRSY
jgi:prepilin-type N-terminal cleavage/methylation domain-containing protein